nr:TonB-dependent receptor [uncultured Dyadobacter sp.]
MNFCTYGISVAQKTGRLSGRGPAKFSTLIRLAPVIQKRIVMRIKITAFLIACACLHVFAEGNAQTVTLSKKNVSLEKIFKEIKSQTGYLFWYENDIVNASKKVNISVRNVSVTQALDLLLRDESLQYSIIDRMIVIRKKDIPRPGQTLMPMLRKEQVPESMVGFTDKTAATSPGTRIGAYRLPDIRVQGRVTDERGDGLPGVSVLLKDTQRGTTSDENGNFLLEVPDSRAILVFSFVGYLPQEMQVGNRTKLDVALKVDTKALEEVVVVGYGTQRKSDITGAIASVNEQSLRDVPVTNLSEALQGRAAGIDIQKNGGNSKPGSPPVIRIRGNRSLGAGNDPLFVVDGLPFNGSINDLNPDDVVSVEVLKDASSTAIYGSRGANGVILVTTKRGKEGGLQVGYSGYVGFTKNLGKFHIMNGPQFRDLKKWSRINGSAPGTYTGLDDPKFMTDGTFDPQEVESINMNRSTDWQDLIYKTGIMTNHQLSVSGGTGKTQYAFSGGYFKETGIYPGQGFDRYAAKLSIDQQLARFIKVGLSSINTFTRIQGENANPMGQVLRASPLTTPYDANGNLWGFVPGSANQVWNPLANFIDGAAVENRRRLGTFTTLYADINLTKGLRYRFNAGAEVRSDVYGNFYASATSNNLGGLSTSRNSTGFRTDYTLENMIIYDKIVAGRHKFNFTGLYSLQESQNQTNEFNNNTILADVLENTNPQLGANLTGTGTYEKWAIISYMGRLNYGFNDKYLLTLTMRSDGSSRLAPGNKFHVFPSAAVAWNLSEEPFMKSMTDVTFLKLRASYGTVGNQGISPYSTLGKLTPVVYNYGSSNVTGAYPTNTPNPSLEWEYTSSFNVGVDFGLRNNRISGSVEYYQQKTNNLLLPQNLPPTTGIPNSILTNVGKTQNQGLEIQLSLINIPGNGRDKFSWTTDLNFFLNRGKIVQLANQVTRDITNNWFVGEPVGTIFDYNKIGIWQNTAADTAAARKLGLSVTGTGSVIGTIKVENTNGDEVINANDRVILGSQQAKWQGGFTNRVAYKGFDFTVVGFARVGGLLISRMHNSGFANTFQGNYNNLVVDYWTPANGQNYYPKPNSASTNTPFNSTMGYFNASFLKIRSLSLGYNLPQGLLKRIGCKSVRLYATANDAFILFSPYRNKYNGIDPEGGSINVDTPATYSMIFGVNITF